MTIKTTIQKMNQLRADNKSEDLRNDILYLKIKNVDWFKDVMIEKYNL